MQTPSDEALSNRVTLLTDLSLNEDDLTEQAKNEFDYHSEILQAFELSRRAIVENDLLSPIGRHLFLSDINQSYQQCKQVLNYMAENSELLHNPLPPLGPLFVCGLPRTGSTLLYNLLACDPHCRAPLYNDMVIDPVPAIQPWNSAEHERRTTKRISTEQQREQLVGRKNVLSSMHPTLPIEEDSHIMQQAGLYLLTVKRSPLSMTEYEDWFYDKNNKAFAYHYHQTFMRMLNSCHAPLSHWLFKWPPHLLFLDALLNQYPRAAIVMTHRRLEEVLPSSCRLVLTWSALYFDDQDPRVRTTLTQRVLRHLDRMIKRMMEFRIRRTNLHRNIIDINYDDLMNQPIATVRRIYDYFQLTWSTEFESAMSNWLLVNPQGKQGRLGYTLDEFSLTSEYIQRRYADYIKSFLSSATNSEKANDNIPS